MNQQQQIKQGQQLLRQGLVSNALKTWLDGLSQSTNIPEELPYWVVLGGYFRAAGQAERALSLHQHAYGLMGSDAYLRSWLEMQLCLDLLALDQAALAQQALQRACQFADLLCCPILQELLSQIYSALGQDEASANALESAIQLYQDDALAVAQCSLDLLKVYARLPKVRAERLKVAIDVANRHLPLLKDQSRPMCIQLGHACQMLGRDEDAARYFKQALQLPTPKHTKKSKPRRLAMVEYKLQQITSDIEIEMLREKNAAQHQHVKQLETAGFRDEITGLYNSRYLAMRWDDLHQQAQQGTALCLLSIGINLFASISEVLGKDAALLMYIQIGQILQAQCPDDAILVTSGTGSFELILLKHERASVEGIVAAVQDKIAKIEQAYLPEPLSVSAGGAYFIANEARDVFQLRANLALFLAQRQETKQICWDGEA
ncbi:diguanylate cyclase [Chitinibacter fontanus]|uniref:Diguanylate cyclase n=1 Tax=Chitinibacter fontanus TaxID=1737446 RepID=A0A7D5ZG58_9NEIS|nr:diguanylate cyclase [Chitinibacter fontanus]QLI81888.1 diguanylate cyclase [Chitinibacter fontanus]